eukprot:sb/3476706/
MALAPDPGRIGTRWAECPASSLISKRRRIFRESPDQTTDQSRETLHSGCCECRYSCRYSFFRVWAKVGSGPVLELRLGLGLQISHGVHISTTQLKRSWDSSRLKKLVFVPEKTN